MRGEMLICLLVGWAYLPGTASAASTEQDWPAPIRYIDEGLFRDSLRERGLTAWLEEYLSEAPAVDPADAALRRREQLLESMSDSGLSREQRQDMMTESSHILTDLIAQYPDHPGTMRWRFESARDLLERIHPTAFDDLLLYDLPGRDRKLAEESSRRAIELLEQVRKDVHERWQSVEIMDEWAIRDLVVCGSLRRLEMMDAQSSLLLTWARFYHTFAADLPDDQRCTAFTSLLEDIIQQKGWTDSPDPAQRCAALIMATVASRQVARLGRSANAEHGFTQADGYADGIVRTYNDISGPQDRKRLRQAALLAVLEQVRVISDSGRFSDALQAIEAAREWTQRSRPNDLSATISIALEHRRILARSQMETTDDNGAAKRRANGAADILKPVDALKPLKELAEQSVRHREAVYAALAGALCSEPIVSTRTPFELQLLLGSAIADASLENASFRAHARRRLAESLPIGKKAVEALPEAAAPVQGELIFLLGQAGYVCDAHLEAVELLTDLAEQHPGHDRAAQAAEQAVAIAQDLLTRPDQANSRTVRDAFVRAGRVLRTHWPASPMVARLPYLIAVALEQNGQLEEAAREYAAVPDNDEFAMRARLGQLRCFRNALHQAASSHGLSESQLNDLAQRSLASAKAAAATMTGTIPEADRSTAAEIVLLQADLLNHATIHQPAEALKVLSGFEDRFADQPEKIGPALRERILALRELKRLSEARLVVERFLKTDPDTAGPVMAKLLETMRDEIDESDNAGNTDEMRKLAVEASLLAESLLTWSQQKPSRMTAADGLTIRIWQAWSTRHAARNEDALTMYDSCEATCRETPACDPGQRFEIQLGRAECLLDLDRPAEALPLFAEIWQRSREQSPHWWRALVGSLHCHTQLRSDPKQIVQTVRQQKNLFPELGAPKWRRALETIEQTNLARMAEATK